MTNLAINFDNPTIYSYDLKKYDGADITYSVGGSPESLAENIESITLAATTLSIKLKNNPKIFKFLNVNSDKSMKIFNGGDIGYNGGISEFYYEYAATPYIKRNNVITGTVLNDDIDVHDQEYNGKGFNINSKEGNDTIIGSQHADTITGGAGNNEIVYSGEFDTDTINLTKTENLTINIASYGISLNSLDNIKNYISVNNANLEIAIPNKGKIVLQNFVKTDVIGPTGSVVVKYGNNPSDVLNLNIDLIKEYAWDEWTAATFTKLTFTGTRLSEKFNMIHPDSSSDFQPRLINANAGNDEIISGSGDDTINGGDGNDTIEGYCGNDKITGGTGADEFVFSQGDNVDTIMDASSTDKIRIKDVNAADIKYRKNGSNLEIVYNESFGEEDKAIVQGYFSKKADQRVDELITQDDTISLAQVIAGNQNNPSSKYAITGKGNISGTANGDYILGSTKNDVLKGLAGNDKLAGLQGNNKLYGGAGDDTFIFTNLDNGTNTVFSETGNDIIKFQDYDTLEDLHQGVTLCQDGTNLKIKYNNGAADVIIDKYFQNLKQGKEHSVQTVQTKGGGAESIDELIEAFIGDDDYTFLKRYGKGVNDDIIGGVDADTLINTKANYTYMSGGAGEDVYVVNNFAGSYTSIDDSGICYAYNPDCEAAPVSNNTLQIKNVKSSDLAIFFDVCIGDALTNEPHIELGIIKKSLINPKMSMANIKKGIIEIPYYMRYDGSENPVQGANYISTIQTTDKKGNVTATLDVESYMEALRPTIVEIITEAGCESVTQVFGSDNEDAKIALINAYKNQPINLVNLGMNFAPPPILNSKNPLNNNYVAVDNLRSSIAAEVGNWMAASNDSGYDNSSIANTFADCNDPISPANLLACDTTYQQN